MLLAACGFGYGQNVNAVVTGTVTDASGASIPGASVTLSNNATGTKQATTTSESGAYRIGDLIPWNLSKMTIGKEGFTAP